MFVLGAELSKDGKSLHDLLLDISEELKIALSLADSFVEDFDSPEFLFRGVPFAALNYFFNFIHKLLLGVAKRYKLDLKNYLQWVLGCGTEICKVDSPSLVALVC